MPLTRSQNQQQLEQQEPPRFSQSKYVMVFDVETNGFPPRAHILQISWVIYCRTTRRIVEVFDSYVQVDPAVVEISDKITAINHCSYELCATGKPILDILQAFYSAYTRCDWIVAHNIDFDSRMVIVEYMRNWESIRKSCPNGLKLFREDYVYSVQKRLYCRMKSSIQLCKLSHVNSAKSKFYEQKNEGKEATEPSYKYPKLIELYQHLFGKEKEIEGLHNSMVDVQVCLQCFLRLMASS